MKFDALFQLVLYAAIGAAAACLIAYPLALLLDLMNSSRAPEFGVTAEAGHVFHVAALLGIGAGLYHGWRKVRAG